MGDCIDHADNCCADWCDGCQRGEENRVRVESLRTELADARDTIARLETKLQTYEHLCASQAEELRLGAEERDALRKARDRAHGQYNELREVADGLAAENAAVCRGWNIPDGELEPATRQMLAAYALAEARVACIWTVGDPALEGDERERLADALAAYRTTRDETAEGGAPLCGDGCTLAAGHPGACETATVTP